MMKIAVDAEDFSQAEKYADQVLANKNSPSVKEQAQIIKARSSMKRGNDSEAKKLIQLLKNLLTLRLPQKRYMQKLIIRTKEKRLSLLTRRSLSFPIIMLLKSIGELNLWY